LLKLDTFALVDLALKVMLAFGPGTKAMLEVPLFSLASRAQNFSIAGDLLVRIYFDFALPLSR